MLRNFYYWFHREISKKPEERDEPSGGWWHNRVRREAVNLCQKCKGSLLEVGCGEGLFITRLAVLNPQLEITGIDSNRKKLLNTEKRCEEKQLKNVMLIYGNAVNLPFEDEQFETIVCINTFFNMESIDIANDVLTQMVRVCRRKGRVIFDFRNSLNPFLRLKYKLAPYYDPTVKEDRLPLNTYNPKHIETILRELNLAVVNKVFIGFPKNVLSPIIIIDAKKC